MRIAWRDADYLCDHGQYYAGTLTSFLNPPPGFVMPQLSPAQEANIPKLKQLRQGLATVAYDRYVC
jgi:hypothetical protein